MESERWYWRTYFSGSSGDTDTEHRLMDTGVGSGEKEEVGRRERVGLMERVVWKHTQQHM